MLGPNWTPPSDKDGMGDDVSWRDDPSVRQWPRPAPTPRLRLGRSGIVDSAEVDATAADADVAGLPDDQVVLVLVDGKPTLLALSRAQALAIGHTVLDADDDVLAAAGVVVRQFEPELEPELELWPEIPPIIDDGDAEPVEVEPEFEPEPWPVAPSVLEVDDQGQLLVHDVHEVPAEPQAEERWWGDEPSAPPEIVLPVPRSDIVRLSASGVVKRMRNPHGPVTVLAGADVVIRAGELVVVTGSAGCGTSVLLNCLVGFDDVDEGEVVLDGQPWREESDAVRARHRCASVGFAGQENDLVEYFTAAENVEVPLLCAGWRRHEARAAAIAMLGCFTLARQAEFSPAYLSTSGRQCVLLARALVGEPLVVVLDQPTALLDDAQTAQLMGCLTALQQRQSAILVATRDRRIIATASQVLTLQQGRLHTLTS